MTEHLSHIFALARAHEGRRKGRILVWGTVDGERIDGWTIDRPDIGYYADADGENHEVGGYRIEEFAQLSTLPPWRRWLHNVFVRLWEKRSD